MKKLLTILFLFYAVLSFGQTSVKYRQATLDTLRLKDLPALPSVVANFTAVVAYNDSLWFQDKNGTLYNILDWLDSIAAHRIELDAHLDSLIRHTENYYSLRDSVGDNIDSIAQHRVEIDAITAGENHIGHDTYFTGEASSGDTVNLWVINKQNLLRFGIPWLYPSGNTEPDARLWWNIPLERAVYGDTLGYYKRVGNYPLSHEYGIADGGDGLVKRGRKLYGNTYATDSLFVRDSAVLVKELDPIYAADSALIMDSLASYDTRLLAVLDSLADHRDTLWDHSDRIVVLEVGGYITESDLSGIRDTLGFHADSLIMLVDSLAYYILTTDLTDSLNVVRDSLADHRTMLDNHADSIINHTTRYYAILDSLAVHDGNYYSLRDTVRGLIADTANLLHWADTVGIIATHSMLDSLTTSVYDSIQRHSGNYYSLRDSVIANIGNIASQQDSITKHTGWHYTQRDSIVALLDSVSRHSDNYYTLRDSVINNTDSITKHTGWYYSLRDSVTANLDSIQRHTDNYYTLRDSVIANQDSISKHTGWFYTLRDSVGTNITNIASLQDSITKHTGWHYTQGDSIVAILDSIGRHTDNYYTLQDSVIQNIADIAAIEAGENHIANDTYFTGETSSGDTVGLWKIDSFNNFYKGRPELSVPQNTIPDGWTWWNTPLRNAVYGDSVGFRYRAGGYEIFKSYGIADGGLGLVKRRTDFRGVVTVQDSLLIPLRAYDATTWNNSTRATSEDAVRDRIVVIYDSLALHRDTLTDHAGRLDNLEDDTWANTTLSNLTSPTAINQDLLPGIGVAFGGNLNRWNIWGDLTRSNTMTFTNYIAGPVYLMEVQTSEPSTPEGYGGIFVDDGDSLIYYRKPDDGAILGPLIGGGGGGSVSSITQGNGMNFSVSPITSTGTINLGTPSNITPSSTNSVSGTTHSHALVIDAALVPNTTAAADLGSTSKAWRDLFLQANGSSYYTKLLSSATANRTVTLPDGTVTLMANPMTTAGDIIYGGASGVPTRLGKGADGQFLTLSSGIPAWAAAPGATTPGGNVNEIQYNNAGAFGGLSVFTWDGTFFTTNADNLIRDNKDLIFGDGEDGRIHSDGTNFIFTVKNNQDLYLGYESGAYGAFYDESQLKWYGPSDGVAGPQIWFDYNGNLDAEGYIDANGGFKKGGTAGVSGTYNNPTQMVVTGGIVTSVTTSEPQPSPMMPSIDYKQIANDWATGLRYSTRMIEFRDREYRFTEMVYDRGLLVSVSPGKWQRMNLIQRMIYR